MEEQQIKVSVIIPVYNVAPYLRQCLDSIINQTLKEIEIICVDDGSTDESLHILQEYAAQDSRIVVLSQNNAGAGIARNAGMKTACGQYLSILDADDFFEATMLEKAYRQCEVDHADFCVFRSAQFDNEKNLHEEIPWTIKRRYLPKQIPFSAADSMPYIFQIFNGWSWDKLYRREFVEKTGLQFQNLRTTNDAFFVFMANVQADKITILDEILAYHRVNLSTSLSVTREKSWACCYQAITAIKTELTKRNQYQIAEQSFINWALHFLLWNGRTLSGESRTNFVRALREKYFVELEFSKYSKTYFYNQEEYRQYCKLLQNDTMPTEETVFDKTMRYYKENGVTATIKKLRKTILKK